MDHIAHLRKSSNQWTHMIISSRWFKEGTPIIYFLRIEWFFIWKKLNSLHPRRHCAKFGCKWPSGSWEEDENVKSLRRQRQRRQRRTTDKLWSEKITWAFDPGEINVRNQKIQSHKLQNDLNIYLYTFFFLQIP